LRATIRFLAGFLAGCIPFAAFLATRGAFVEFLRVSFVDVPKTITPTWGLPAPSLAEGLRSGSLASLFDTASSREAPSLAVLLAALAVAVVLLLFRRAENLCEPIDRSAVLTVVVAMLALRGALGRADVGHRMLYGIFAGLPAAWLFYRAFRIRSRLRPFVAGASAVACFLLLRPDRAVGRELRTLEASVGARRLDLLASRPFGGSAFAVLERAQANDLEDLRRSIDGLVPPQKTFFDFGNEPALYFLLDRRPPVRYSCVPAYQTVEKQREVIAALERARPPVAILASGTGRDSFDGVSNRERAPLVARYLDRNYEAAGRVGSRSIALRKDR
jgi:hypothetical protein